VLAGLLLALAGAVVVGLSDACGGAGCPSGQAFWQGRAFGGDLLAALGALAFAIYLVVGRALRATVSLTSYIFTTYATAAALLGLVLWQARLPLTGYSPPAYVWLTLLALVPQLVGHSAFNWALKYLPATLISVALLGEPAGSIVLAAVLLHEVPGPLELAGCVLILAGIVLATRPAQTRMSNL
jgi:drug/metabolite transporter (DMT)-like permease